MQEYIYDRPAKNTPERPLYDAYVEHQKTFWVQHQIVPSVDDQLRFDVLDTNTKTLVKNILVFFATADGLVNRNLDRFIEEASAIAPNGS